MIQCRSTQHSNEETNTEIKFCHGDVRVSSAKVGALTICHPPLHCCHLNIVMFPICICVWNEKVCQHQPPWSSVNTQTSLSWQLFFYKQDYMHAIDKWIQQFPFSLIFYLTNIKNINIQVKHEGVHSEIILSIFIIFSIV